MFFVYVIKMRSLPIMFSTLYANFFGTKPMPTLMCVCMPTGSQSSEHHADSGMTGSMSQTTCPERHAHHMLQVHSSADT